MLWSCAPGVYQVEWLHSVSVFPICSPFHRLMPLRWQNSWTDCSREISGGNREFGLSPLISVCGEIKEGKGSLIKRHVSNPLSGWEEIFLMKCNTLPNCSAASGAQYTFQSKICMNIKCRISQLRPDMSERTGRRNQSLWWCMKRASSSPSMYFSSLPFIWQLSIFHSLQNKQLECSVLMLLRLRPQWNLHVLICAYL